ncbi:UNVERIFIED_CONTAM: hypothetical protein FKN15_055252 [Acipenser sinensis]
MANRRRQVLQAWQPQAVRDRQAQAVRDRQAQAVRDRQPKALRDRAGAVPPKATAAADPCKATAGGEPLANKVAAGAPLLTLVLDALAPAAGVETAPPLYL